MLTQALNYRDREREKAPILNISVSELKFKKCIQEALLYNKQILVYLIIMNNGYWLR